MPPEVLPPAPVWPDCPPDCPDEPDWPAEPPPVICARAAAAPQLVRTANAAAAKYPCLRHCMSSLLTLNGFARRTDRQTANSPLSKILFDFDVERRHKLHGSGGQFFAQPASDPPRQPFGRGILDGQQHAIFSRKHPAALLERDLDFFLAGPHIDGTVFSRNQHAVIQLCYDFLGGVAQGDEIDDIEILVQTPGRLHRDPPVMPVQPFAGVPVERDEMRSTEDQMVFRDPDAVGFVHRNRAAMETPGTGIVRTGAGKGIVPGNEYLQTHRGPSS